jgi:Flp pilus assembly CpaF family ATPase
VYAEARRRGADHIRQLVILGDGAMWIWKLATKILPEASQILDLYHAREHVHDLARHLAPVVGDDQPAWTQARLADLDNGNIEGLSPPPTTYRWATPTATRSTRRWTTLSK